MESEKQEERFSAVLDPSKVESSMSPFFLSGDAWGVRGPGYPSYRHPAFCPEKLLLLNTEKCATGDPSFPAREVLRKSLLRVGQDLDEMEASAQRAVSFSPSEEDWRTTELLGSVLGLSNDGTKLVLPLGGGEGAGSPAWVISLPHLFWILCERDLCGYGIAISVARLPSFQGPQSLLAFALLVWSVVQCLRGDSDWPLSPALLEKMESLSQGRLDLGFRFPPHQHARLTEERKSEHSLGVLCVEPCAVSRGTGAVSTRREFLVFPTFERDFQRWISEGGTQQREKPYPVFLHECVGEGGGGLHGLVKPFADVEKVFPADRFSSEELDYVETKLARAVSWVLKKHFALGSSKPMVQILSGSRPVDELRVKWSLHVLVVAVRSSEGHSQVPVLPAGSACRAVFTAVERRWQKRCKNHPLTQNAIDMGVYDRHHMLRAPGSSKWCDTLSLEASQRLSETSCRQMSYPLVPWDLDLGKEEDPFSVLLDPDYWVTAVPLRACDRLELVQCWSDLPDPLKRLSVGRDHQPHHLLSLFHPSLSLGSDIDREEVECVLACVTRYQENMWASGTPPEVQREHHHQCPRPCLRRINETGVRNREGRCSVYILDLLHFHACPRLGRLHRTNRVTVHVTRSGIFVGCLDPDCREDLSGKGMKRIATLDGKLLEDESQ